MDVERTQSGAGELPRISVVVPSYNQGRFLRDCLDSLFRQDYPDLEVVIMDGGSTDESVDIIRSYAGRLKHWQSGKDGGQSAAINAGMRHCTGHLVAWLNSDDFYWRDALWSVGRAWRDFPGRGLYVGNGFRFDQKSGKYVPFLARHVAIDREALARGPDYVLQPSTFFLRQAWEKVGGLKPDLRYCMDWDLFLRITRHYPAVAINEFLGVSREYEDTKTQSGGLGRAHEILGMIQSHTGRELTPGTACYMLDTVRNMMREELTPEAVKALDDAIWESLQLFSQTFGDGCWSPAHPDWQDDSYLPFARAGDRRPRQAVDAAALPTVSIVIPIRDCTGPELEETVASVLAQDYPKVEVLFVDAGKSDEAAVLAGQHAGQFLRVPAPATDNDARLINRGLGAASGELLGWLAPGDLLAHGALLATAETFAAEPDIDLLFANVLFIDSEGQAAVTDIIPYRSAFWYGRIDPCKGAPGYDGIQHAVPQPTLCFRRRLLERVGLLDESLDHIFDYEWVRRAAARGARLKKLERTQALCRIGARPDAGRWEAMLAEMYRYSRPRWPWPWSRRYWKILRWCIENIVRRKFGVYPRGALLPSLRVGLGAMFRLGNPERWWPGRYPVPRCGSPPFHLPPPPLQVRPPLPLAYPRETPPRQGLPYHSVVCLPTLPPGQAASGPLARDDRLLYELYRHSTVELFTLRRGPSDTAAAAADIVHTPDRPAKTRLGVWLRPPQPESFLARTLNDLRARGVPVPGFSSPVHVTRLFPAVRSYCTTAIDERLAQRSGRPHFLFVGDQTNPLVLTLEKKDADVRLVLIARGVEARRLRQRARREWGPRRLGLALEARRGRKFEAQNLACFDAVIAASEDDRRVLIEEHGFTAERVLVVGPGVDVAFWGQLPHCPEGPAVIAWMGDLNSDRGAKAAGRFVHKVLPRVRQARPEARCWLVHRGEAPADAGWNQPGIEVIHAADDPRPALARATVVCVSGCEDEWLDRPILEALAAGVPVVAPVAAAVGLSLEAGRDYLAAKGPAACAAAVVQVLEAPKVAQALAQDARAVVKLHHDGAASVAALRDWLNALARLSRRHQGGSTSPATPKVEAAAAA